MEKGAIAKWHKSENNYVEAGELLLEVATDKATLEYNALDSGWLRAILVKEGEEAAVSEAIAIFSEEEKEDIATYIKAISTPAASQEVKREEPALPREQLTEATAMRPAAAEPLFAPEPPLQGYAFEFPLEAAERMPSSPLARKLAKERGLDLSTVIGSGPRGRIVSADLEKALPLASAAFGPRQRPKEASGSYNEEPLSPMRKVIAQRLQEAKSFIPHFYVQQAVDATPLLALREQLQAYDLKISINDCIVRACAIVLRHHPTINSGFHSGKRSIIRFKTVDISVAVSIKGGLITPLVRYADYKNVGEIAAELRALAARARAGKLQPHEYKGGSFTISNLGMYGITAFQAIINPPQAAILAVGAICDEPVVRQGSLAAGKVMQLILSCDHRVIDGAAAAEFLRDLKKQLENPATLLL